MKKCIVVMNHSLTEFQKTELETKWDVDEIILYEGVLWKKIEPYGQLDTEALNEVISFIKNNSKQNDLIVVQGEFGATFYVADFCLKTGRIPVYATSERIYKEEILSDESIKREHIFKHVNFRKYRAFEV